MKLIIGILLLSLTSQLNGQELAAHEPKSARDGLHLSVVISHTFIPERTVNGKTTVAIPSLGFDVEYFLTKRFGIGLHNDLELLVYEVKENDNSYIKREFPVLLTADLLYKIKDDLILFGGPGVELEKERDIPVLRFGLEYMAHVGTTLTFSPIISYDYRIDSFNSFSLGIGIGFGL